MLIHYAAMITAEATSEQLHHVWVPQAVQPCSATLKVPAGCHCNAVQAFDDDQASIQFPQEAPA